jgi:hypothetical protein
MGSVAVMEHAAEVRERAKHAVEEGREAASSVLSDARQIADTARDLVPGTERRRAKKSRRRWLVFAILLGGAIGFAVWRAQNRREDAASPNELRPFDRATDRSSVEAVESTAPDAFGAVVAEEQADQLKNRR